VKSRRKRPPQGELSRLDRTFVAHLGATDIGLHDPPGPPRDHIDQLADAVHDEGDLRPCQQRHRDPVTGTETVVFSCFNQDQEMDRVDFRTLRRRLSQNGVQEKLTKLWVDRCCSISANVPPSPQSKENQKLAML
jgi:hypothetical protein